MSLQSIVRNIAANWVGLAVNVVISFFLAPFIVNKLGATQYGIWAVVMQFTGYMYLMDFGVRDSVIRYVSKYRAHGKRQRLNEVLTVAFMLYAPFAVLGVLISFAAGAGFARWFNIDPHLARDAALAVFLSGLTISQTFVFNVFSGVLQGLQRFDVSNGIGLVFGIVRAGIVVAALRNGMGIVALAAIHLAMGFLGGLAEAFFAKRLLRRESLDFQLVKVTPRRRKAMFGRMFGYSVYVFINNIGQKIILASGAIIAGLYMPIATVSYFAIASSLIDYFRNLVGATAQVFNPLASHYSALKDYAAVRVAMLRGARLGSVISLPILLVYVIMGREFIHLWMGEDFAAAAAEVLIVLAVTQIFSAPHHTVTSVLYGMSRHRFIAVLRILEAAVNLPLSIYLVKRMGLVGVAWGAAIPHVLMTTVLLPLFACRTIKLGWFDYLWQVYVIPLLAAIPLAACAWWVINEFPAGNLAVFFLQVAALMVVYLPFVFLIVLTREERQLVTEFAFRKLGRASPA